jgi:hypothetical protein
VRNPSPKTDWQSAPIAVYVDPIFFSKYNIKVGTWLRHFGRRASGTRWQVEAIWTFKPSPRGLTRHYVTAVQKLDDILELRSDDGQRRTLRFGYASYSAIWRMEE